MYGKIFDSIYDGTLYGHWEAIVTMQQLIVLATPDGLVDMTPQAIAARTSIPFDIICKGLEVLAKPDPYTRTPGEDGKRIVLVDDHRPWGWRLVNHGKYMRLRDIEQKREADRQRIAEKRRKNKDVATVSQNVANVAYSDSYLDSDLREEKAAPAAANAASAVPAKRMNGKKPIGDWVPTDELVSKLQTRYQKTPEQMQRHYTALRDYCLATGRKYADFEAAYRISVRDNWGYK